MSSKPFVNCISKGFRCSTAHPGHEFPIEPKPIAAVLSHETPHILRVPVARPDRRFAGYLAAMPVKNHICLNQYSVPNCAYALGLLARPLPHLEQRLCRCQIDAFDHILTGIEDITKRLSAAAELKMAKKTWLSGEGCGICVMQVLQVLQALVGHGNGSG